jgi:hypothetical protein
VARACGYRDWHELEQQVSPGHLAILDQDLSVDKYVNRQIEMTLSVAESTNVIDDDAQFALAMANLTGDRKTDLTEQLAIRAGCLRRTSLPDLGRRQRGSIGRLKSPGRNGELVILKRFGQITHVLTHVSLDAAVADFEFVTPRLPVPLFVPMWLYLAYGVWTEKDGAHVLFSRDYMPLWRLKVGEKPGRINPWDWIRFEQQEWFWDDTATPWSSKRRYEDELKRLRHFRVIGLPRLVETLPYLILRDDLRSIEDAVDILREKYEPVQAA